MKKQLFIVGITVLLIAVGLSGCTDKQQADISSLDYSNSQYGFGFNPPEGWVEQEANYSFIAYSPPNLQPLESVMFTVEQAESLDDIYSYADMAVLFIESQPVNSIVSRSERKVNNMNAYEIVYTGDFGWFVQKTKYVYIQKTLLTHFLVIFSSPDYLYDEYNSDFEECLSSFTIV